MRLIKAGEFGFGAVENLPTSFGHGKGEQGHDAVDFDFQQALHGAAGA